MHILEIESTSIQHFYANKPRKAYQSPDVKKELISYMFT